MQLRESRRVCAQVIGKMGTIVFVLFTGVAHAQEYPVKPVRIVVPYSPGLTVDTAARIMAPEMSKVLGQPFVVENKPGADQVIGLTYVATQVPADGYTIAAVTVGGLAILPLVARDLRFDPLKDLPPIVGLAKGRSYLGSSTKLPWKNFAEFVSHTKANPGKFNYGASSPGVRFLMAAIIADLGLVVTYVPYSEGGRYTQALLAAEIQMGVVSDSVVISFGDKFRILAKTGEKSSVKYPDIPTFAELGYPSIPDNTYSLNVPAGMPRAVSEKLHATAVRVLQLAETRSRFDKIGVEIVGDSPEGAARDLALQARFYADVANKVGFKPEH